MSAKPKTSFKVKRDGREVIVFPHPKGWRFEWGRDASGERKFVTRRLKKDAEEEAWKRLGEVAAGGLAWSELDGRRRRFLEAVHREAAAEDEAAVLGFLEARKRSGEVVEAVERFAAWKQASAGEVTPHLQRVFRPLREMAVAFKGKRVADIFAPELEDWFRRRGAGRSDKTRHDLRANLVMFWRWAQRQGIAGADPITPPERMPTVTVGKGERAVWTLDDLKRLLVAVAPDFRVWAVLGAFAGLRPEEIAPPTKAGAKKRDKRGLACEDIDWRFSAVMVPAEVSKVDTPRRVPMSDALRAGLEWAGIRPGMTGPVCLKNPVEERELFRLGKLLFGAAGWPKNALRHSYGSYRNAVIRDLPRLAEEMGTSVGMLNHRYHNPQPEELGEAWFGLDFAADEFRKSSAELDLEQRSGENPARAIC